MNELIFSCSDTLPQPGTPECATDYGERVVTIYLSKTPVSTSQNVPSASDFSIAFDAGSLTIIRGIVNGHKIFLGEHEIEVNFKEWRDKEYRVEGRIRLIDEDVARAAEKLSIYSELIMYYVTEKEYCFGPYEASTNFTLIQTEGKGNPAYIGFHFDFVDIGIDYSNFDFNYDRVPFDTESITVDSTIITVDSTLITADRI